MGNNVEPQRILLADASWDVQSSEKLDVGGEQLSTTAYTVTNWYNGFVPSTIMGVLTTNNGLYEGILEGLNYKDIDRTPFDHSWWYRKEFSMPALDKDQLAKLCFDGLSYSANVWLNGKQIASRDDFYGPFRQFSFDITPYLAEKNVLAVEVFRAQPGDPNIGFVDWNPRPADESMGIFREVYVEVFAKVDMKNTYVHSKVNTETLDEAWLTVETTLVNHSDRKIKGRLVGRFEGHTFAASVTLEAGEEKRVKLTADEVEELHVSNPRIWWCNNMGDPEMYELSLKFQVGPKVLDDERVSFGIR
ncbi:glycoside hydrolase family 2, partial [Bacteroides sp. OttesenSCG-928-D19]|nr:glycoside hydrolase family 2 [Bacteroides sp. OttesenSCG-928-D19]